MSRFDLPRVVALMTAFALTGGSIGACSGDPAARAPRFAPGSARADSLARACQDSINRTLPGYVIDSILPIEEEVRRFRLAAGGTPVTALGGGSPSREALVRRFVAALAAGDSTGLAAMALSPREFIDLVYLESPYTRPPYRQAPQLLWGQMQNSSRKGFIRLLRRVGGLPLHYVSHRCATPPEVQGRNRLHAACTVAIRDDRHRTETHRLFGSIIARDGIYKFVGYANEF